MNRKELQGAAQAHIVAEKTSHTGIDHRIPNWPLSLSFQVCKMGWEQKYLPCRSIVRNNYLMFIMLFEDKENDSCVK